MTEITFDGDHGTAAGESRRISEQEDLRERSGIDPAELARDLAEQDQRRLAVTNQRRLQAEEREADFQRSPELRDQIRDAVAEHPPTCPNCGQYQRPRQEGRAGEGLPARTVLDCLNDCRQKGLVADLEEQEAARTRAEREAEHPTPDVLLLVIEHPATGDPLTPADVEGIVLRAASSVRLDRGHYIGGAPIDDNAGRTCGSLRFDLRTDDQRRCWECNGGGGGHGSACPSCSLVSD